MRTLYTKYKEKRITSLESKNIELSLHLFETTNLLNIKTAIVVATINYIKSNENKKIKFDATHNPQEIQKLQRKQRSLSSKIDKNYNKLNKLKNGWKYELYKYKNETNTI